MWRHPGEHLREKLSSDEIQHFRRLLSELDSPFAATSNYVQSVIAFNAHLDSSFVNSSDNRHMTGSSKHLQNYYFSPNMNYVRIANSSLTPISGTVSVVCAPDITLSCFMCLTFM